MRKPQYTKYTVHDSYDEKFIQKRCVIVDDRSLSAQITKRRRPLTNRVDFPAWGSRSEHHRAKTGRKERKTNSKKPQRTTAVGVTDFKHSEGGFMKSDGLFFLFVGYLKEEISLTPDEELTNDLRPLLNEGRNEREGSRSTWPNTLRDRSSLYLNAWCKCSISTIAHVLRHTFINYCRQYDPLENYMKVSSNSRHLINMGICCHLVAAGSNDSFKVQVHGASTFLLLHHFHPS